MIILDTSVISEIMSRSPSSSVVNWYSSIGAAQLATTAITVHEIEYGIGRLPEGRRRDSLAAAWTRVLASFREQVLPLDIEAALAVAGIRAGAEKSGRPMSLANAQIAGICLSRGCTLATRNVADFEAVDELDILNPFEQETKGGS